MEFNKKLQELRKQRGLTQEELARSLYVSRTAISKWELGKGYPNIDSLKNIADFFGVTVDELLSSSEIMTLAKEDSRKTEKHYRDLIFGLLDCIVALLLFLPLFAMRSGGEITTASLLALDGVRLYLVISYFVTVISASLMGILTLALQNIEASVWLHIKAPISLTLSTILVLLFIISSQPYAAVFAFVLLIIKALLLIKRA